MSDKNDKRRMNRIQGGWASNKNKKSTKKSDISPTSISGFTPQFDQSTATSYVIQQARSKFELIQITESRQQMDLNEGIPDIDQNDPAGFLYLEDFMSDTEADFYMSHFTQNLAWEQRENMIEGQSFLEPRQTCWYGLPYGYTGLQLEANMNWDPVLKELMTKVQMFAKPEEPLNSVFCNLYRTGKDSIAWHADNEAPLGSHPTIVSISLGSKRVFELCRKKEFAACKDTKSPYRSRDDKNNPPFSGCTVLYSVHLRPGSLAVMSGSTQLHWLHRVPKEYHDQFPRINLTFRHIIPAK